MNKQNILIISVSMILVGVIGFYGGRYYERATFRKSFEQRRQNFPQGSSMGIPRGAGMYDRGDNFRPHDTN